MQKDSALLALADEVVVQFGGDSASHHTGLQLFRNGFAGISATTDNYLNVPPSTSNSVGVYVTGMPFSNSWTERCKGPETSYRQGHRRKLKRKTDYVAVSRSQDTTDIVEHRVGQVHLDCRGQWGNWLGQYAIARIVADKLNFGLDVCPMLLDKNWQKGHIFPGLVELGVDMSKLDNGQVPTIELGKHAYNVRKMLTNSTPRILHMWGYPFDDVWPFEHFKPEILKFLKPDIGCIYWNQSYPGTDDVVVHIRSYNSDSCGGQTEETGTRRREPKFSPNETFVDPPYKYYKQILDKMKAGRGWKKLWLASRCGLKDVVAERLAEEYGAILTPLAEVHPDTADFLFMLASRRLVMTQSTFAWWAAFLGGGAEEVHYPLVGEWWGKRPRHRLYPSESRYIFHDLYADRMFLTREDIETDIASLKPPFM
jgi:hypothetical protein